MFLSEKYAFLFVNSSNTEFPSLDAIASFDRSGSYYWRIQPVGFELDHTSENYLGDDVIDGVWAFESLFGLVLNLVDPLFSYIGQVLRDGQDPEIVAIKGINVEDGPDDSVIIRSGEIIERFDINSILEDLAHFTDDDEYFDEESLWNFLEGR